MKIILIIFIFMTCLESVIDRDQLSDTGSEQSQICLSDCSDDQLKRAEGESVIERLVECFSRFRDLDVGLKDWDRIHLDIALRNLANRYADGSKVQSLLLETQQTIQMNIIVNLVTENLPKLDAEVNQVLEGISTNRTSALQDAYRLVFNQKQSDFMLQKLKPYLINCTEILRLVPNTELLTLNDILRNFAIALIQDQQCDLFRDIIASDLHLNTIKEPINRAFDELKDFLKGRDKAIMSELNHQFIALCYEVFKKPFCIILKDWYPCVRFALSKLNRQENHYYHKTRQQEFQPPLIKYQQEIELDKINWEDLDKEQKLWMVLLKQTKEIMNTEKEPIVVLDEYLAKIVDHLILAAESGNREYMYKCFCVLGSFSNHAKQVELKTFQENLKTKSQKIMEHIFKLITESTNVVSMYNYQSAWFSLLPFRLNTRQVLGEEINERQATEKELDPFFEFIYQNRLEDGENIQQKIAMIIEFLITTREVMHMSAGSIPENQRMDLAMRPWPKGYATMFSAWSQEKSQYMLAKFKAISKEISSIGFRIRLRSWARALVTRFYNAKVDIPNPDLCIIRPYSHIDSVSLRRIQSTIREIKDSIQDPEIMSLMELMTDLKLEEVQIYNKTVHGVTGKINFTLYKFYTDLTNPEKLKTMKIVTDALMYRDAINFARSTQEQIREYKFISFANYLFEKFGEKLSLLEKNAKALKTLHEEFEKQDTGPSAKLLLKYLQRIRNHDYPEIEKYLYERYFNQIIDRSKDWEYLGRLGHYLRDVKNTQPHYVQERIEWFVSELKSRYSSYRSFH